MTLPLSNLILLGKIHTIVETLDVKYNWREVLKIHILNDTLRENPTSTKIQGLFKLINGLNMDIWVVRAFKSTIYKSLFYSN